MFSRYRTQGTPASDSCWQTKQRPQIWWLESEHLPRRGKRGVDFLDRGRRAGGQDQLTWLVVPNSCKTRQIQQARQLEGTAEPTLRSAGDHFEGLFDGERLADCIAQLVEIGGGEAAHWPQLLQKRGRSGNGSRPAWT